ncbi:MAG: TPM domain-containing protein [Xanthomonadaceae bacterium]|nr:TPM domain-containing protein [Xanthomonadaceae bacterium]
MTISNALPGRRRPGRSWLRSLWLVLLLGAAVAHALAVPLAPIPKLDSPVVDTTGMLDAAQRARLTQQALQLQQRKGSQLQILVVPTTQPEDIADYTQRVFDQWSVGRKGVDDGVLLVVAKDDRRVRIQTGYGLEGAIPDITANRVIQEYLVPQFRNGDYAGGIAEASAALVGLIDGEPLPAPVGGNADAPDAPPPGVILIVVALAAIFISRVLRKAPLKIRMVICGVLGAGMAGLMTLSLLYAVFGFFVGMIVSVFPQNGGGRFTSGNGGGSRGGGFGSGGGWGGGGGRSGGGGASGSW